MLLLMSFQSLGFVFTVTEKQLNNMLVVAFPFKQNYQGMDVTFSNPTIKLDSGVQKVIISTTIEAVQSQQKLLAQGTIEGIVTYRSATQELQFEKPALTHFQVLENTIPNTKQTIDTIKQNIGKNLPVILLFDFKQFDLGFGEIVPRDIKITSKGLAITL